MFKLFKTKSRSNNLAPHYILSPNSDHQESDSLWFNRTSGQIYIKKFCQTGDFELAAEQPIFGFVGKFQVNQNHSPKLIFIKRADIVGKLKVKNEEHKIFRIREILVLNSTPPNSYSHDEIECEVLMNDQDLKPSASFTTISSVLNVSSSSLSASTSSEAIAKNATNIGTRFEKKILIEIYKIFQENSGSFYFSYTYDLTNSVERQQEQFERGAKKCSLDWRLADERFFWNKYLLMDVLEINSNEEFVTPVIQGFVQLEQHIINSSKELGPNKEMKAPDPLRLALISRRSRYRLGK
ncbi:phosphatidylinositide phosphatase SAC2 [Brachionus plicatilis]|uniref:Phosphatidylinositide phosphatase SAC2 n=1 Tax=Brachionus plicatilis TaxID=10195 RepID=A0A3M7RPU7_BRAPC|nr:phosphatidylinositide phosphatase SAC2 [Brachionus plicatilis]